MGKQPGPRRGGLGNYVDALDSPGLDYSSTNLSQDASAPAAAGGGGAPVNGVVAFVGAPDYHLNPGDTSAKDRGTNLSADPVLAVLDDIDGQVRQVPWDIGADDADGTTAVKLMSFEAVAADAAVELGWRTGSELDNLGFHLYRGLSESGPWTRLTASLIPGLGSSAVGRAYSFRDGGLVNGTRYFYRLEDVDASSKVTSHGPVSAVPLAGAAGGAPGSEPEASGGKKKGASSQSCPDWVVAAYGSMAGGSASAAALRCTRHGDPEAVSLGVVSRDSRQATLELKTGGFYALHTAVGCRRGSGKVRVFVPGFDSPQDPQAPALPFRRALVDAVVGRRVQLGGVRGLDQVGFRGLVPASLGKAEMQVSQDGTVRAGRRALRESAPEHVSLDLARLLPSVFQGEAKSAVVEITPLRYDARRRQIVLAKRVLVKLLFTGRETGESGRGSFGRQDQAAEAARRRGAGAALHDGPRAARGLLRAAVPGPAAGPGCVAAAARAAGPGAGLPRGTRFGRLRPRQRAVLPRRHRGFLDRLLVRDGVGAAARGGGVRMPLVSARPSGDAVTAASTGQASFETNRFYQPGLLEAPELWLWEALASGATRAKSFSLSRRGRGCAAGGRARGLPAGGVGVRKPRRPPRQRVAERHARGRGAVCGEEALPDEPEPAAVSLREGANELSLTNVADTGVSSYVFLDRFTVAHPQLSCSRADVFEGTWRRAVRHGSARLSGHVRSDVRQ